MRRRVRDARRRTEFDDAPLNRKTIRAIYSDVGKKKGSPSRAILAERGSREAGPTTPANSHKQAREPGSNRLKLDHRRPRNSALRDPFMSFMSEAGREDKRQGKDAARYNESGRR